MYIYVRDRLPTQPVLKPSASFKTGRPALKLAGRLIDRPARLHTQQFPQARFPAFSGPGRLQSDRAKADAGPLVLLFTSGGKRPDTNVLKHSSIVALLAGSFASLLSDPFVSLLTGLFASLLVTCSCFALLFKAHFLHEVVRHAIL